MSEEYTPEGVEGVYEGPVGDGGFAPPTSGMAIGSLVTGIIAVLTGTFGCCCVYVLAPMAILLGGVAFILGFMARKQIASGEAAGNGLAMAGMITGGVGVIFGIGWLILLILAMVGSIVMPQPPQGGGFNFQPK